MIVEWQAVERNREVSFPLSLLSPVVDNILQNYSTRYNQDTDMNPVWVQNSSSLQGALRLLLCRLTHTLSFPSTPLLPIPRPLSPGNHESVLLC